MEALRWSELGGGSVDRFGCGEVSVLPDFGSSFSNLISRSLGSSGDRDGLRVWIATYGDGR